MNTNPPANLEKTAHQFDLADAGPERRSAVPPAQERRKTEWRGPDRRKPSLKSFIYGAFNPRRRRIRREEDRDSAFIDWYPTHLLVVAGLIMLLSLADGLLTVRLLNAGATELNPLLAVLVHNDPLWFALGKVFLTAAGVVSLVIVSQARVLKKWPMTLMIYGLLFLYMALVAYSTSLSMALSGQPQ